MKRFLFAVTCAALLGASSTPEYSIEAIRFANSPGDSVASLVMGAPKDEKIDTVYIVWLIRGRGRNILFDSGFTAHAISSNGRLRITCGPTQPCGWRA